MVTIVVGGVSGGVGVRSDDGEANGESDVDVDDADVDETDDGDGGDDRVGDDGGDDGFVVVVVALVAVVDGAGDDVGLPLP